MPPLNLQNIIDETTEGNVGGQSVLATPQTPATFVEESDFTIETPEVVTSDTASQDVTFDDVLQERARIEATPEPEAVDLTQEQEIAQRDLSAGVFDDPTAFIEEALFGEDEPTQTELDIAELRAAQTERAAGIGEALTSVEERAQRETGLFGLQDELAQTQTQIARRRTALRRRIRQFEQDAIDRGVARAVSDRERSKIVADANAELADLAIIEAAQRGNLDRAEQFINTAVENRYRNFEIENQEAQARIAERLPQLEKEEKREALQLQLALQQQEREIQIRKDEDKARRELLMTAAANGAGQQVQQRILNSRTLDEAYAFAGPFIGRMDRLKANAAIQGSYLSNRLKLIELAKAGDTNALKQLGGSFLPEGDQITDYLRNQEDYAALGRDINKLTSALSNDVGLQLASGASQTAIGSAIATGGLVAPALYPQYFDAKSDFLGNVTQVINTFGLNELVDLKSQGATFGALTDKEFGAIKSSALGLAAIAEFDEQGRVTGFSASEDQVRALTEEAIFLLQESQKRLNTELVDQSDAAEIIRR